MRACAHAVAGLAVLAACAGPPWYMGSPRDGRPSIPGTTAAPSRAELRRTAADERARCCTGRELRALLALSQHDLEPGERVRLACLLMRRAGDHGRRGRPIAMSEDLRRAAALDPSRAMAPDRAGAIERAAGDAWLAIGEPERALAAYRRAGQAGAADLQARQAVAAHTSLAVVGAGELERALRTLPVRSTPELAEEYLARGGADPELLLRARQGARSERRAALAARIESRLREVGGVGADSLPAPVPPVLPVIDVECGACARVDEGAREDRPRFLLAGPSVAARVLPALMAEPALMADEGARERLVLLVAEDQTSPDVWEAAALIDGAAGRTGAVEEDLRNLVYSSPGRGAGLRRAAQLWQRVGQPQRACAAWLRAARWEDDPHAPAWAEAARCGESAPPASQP